MIEKNFFLFILQKRFSNKGLFLSRVRKIYNVNIWVNLLNVVLARISETENAYLLALY
jgi:hypothetical protein